MTEKAKSFNNKEARNTIYDSGFIMCENEICITMNEISAYRIEIKICDQ